MKRPVVLEAPSSVVYMALGRLLLDPPGKRAFHRMDPARSHFPRYVPDPEASAIVGYAATKPDGTDETHYTFCGRLIYRYPSPGPYAPSLDGIRLDNAELVGRPCWTCWQPR